MLITLIIAILVFCFMGFYFYKTQNQNKLIGGAISIPKVIWLFFALFQYYFFSVFLFLLCFGTYLTPVITIAITLFFLRLVTQIIFMYILKKWKPPIGISFNLLSFCIILSFLIYYMSGNILVWTAWDRISFLYLILVLGMLIADSHYAWQFYKIVGNKTIGPDAIWFASAEDPIYKNLNQTTALLNICFIAYFAVILILLFNNYGSFVY